MTEHQEGHLDGLPLVLRSEPFGGLLFIPNEAVHVELDHEGYAFVRDYLGGRRSVQNEAERELLARLHQELPNLESRRLEVFENFCRGAAAATGVVPVGGPTIGRQFSPGEARRP